MNQPSVPCIILSLLGFLGRTALSPQPIDTVCGGKPLGFGPKCHYNSVGYGELDMTGGHEKHEATSVIARCSQSTYCPFSTESVCINL